LARSQSRLLTLSYCRQLTGIQECDGQQQQPSSTAANQRWR